MCQLAAAMVVITETDDIDISNSQCRRRRVIAQITVSFHRKLGFESGHVRRRIVYETYLISAGPILNGNGVFMKRLHDLRAGIIVDLHVLASYRNRMRQRKPLQGEN
jgi:hypothetical protein